uniref:NADH dehydrogenase subunit 4 n=1 Tax=Discus perspectivus TaxID=697275 RepID=UPI002176F000|nr:NADH dehydrogenase subunit 4 [Discus perspectivus]UUB71745.1 NADH dehydrogenase subunit 4 [Discus perspectivus]
MGFFLICGCVVSIFCSMNWLTTLMMSILLLLGAALNLNGHLNYMEVGFMLKQDKISAVLIFLTLMTWVLVLISTRDDHNTYHTFWVNLTVLFLVFAFSVDNILMFYFAFEAVLIPVFILITCWGYQPERFQAGFYMMLYTVAASFPLLLCILYLKSEFNTLCIFMMKNELGNVTPFLYWFFVLAFLVKLPIFGFHLWLPKAHVEAPLSGSMFLASVMLKLGGYGLYLGQGVLEGDSFTNSNILLVSMSLVGGVAASFLCIVQNDIKAMVAYSSVAHMSLVIAGLTLGSMWSVNSALLMMFAHGFTSSCMFLLAYITYKWSGSRSFSLSKGMLSVNPLMGLWWVLVLMYNMGVPPSLNFFSEIFIFPLLFSAGGFLWGVMMGMLLFCGVLFNMLLYVKVNHGPLGAASSIFSNFKTYYSLGVLLHLLPLGFLLKLYPFVL